MRGVKVEYGTDHALEDLLQSIDRPGGLLRARSAVRPDAAVGGRWRRPALLSGSGGAGSGLDRGGGARSLRQGAGHAGGHLGPRLPADRLHAGPTVRQGVAGHAREDPGRGGSGPRLPERPSGSAPLQAARLRNGRLLLAAPRHRESRRDDRDPVDLVAHRGGRRRADRPPPGPRDHRRHERRRALRARVRGLLRRLHPRDPARRRRPSPVARVQPVCSRRRFGYPPGSAGLHRAGGRDCEAARRVAPRRRCGGQAGLAARARVQRGGALLRRVEERRRRLGEGPCAGCGARRLRALRHHRPHRGARRRDLRRRLSPRLGHGRD